MQVPPSAKFACWFFSHASVADDIPNDALVRDGVYVARELGVGLAEHWKEWLGSFVTGAIKIGGLALYVAAPSRHPEIPDDEDKALRQRCEDVLHGLLLQGVPIFESSMSFDGANVGGQIQVRQYAQGRELQHTFEMPEFVPNLPGVHRAVRFAQRLRVMQNAEEQQWGRLLRSTRVLLNGNRVTNAHGERFHQFIRVLDGLAKTEKGAGARQFAHRIQTFVVASQETRDTLLEMYDLRGKVEHVNDLLDAIVLPKTASADPATHRRLRIAGANRFMRWVDALARFVVCRILDSDDLFETFRVEDQIDAFWVLPDDQRIARWGERLDIRAIG
jgi:hypothetical protein